MEFLEGGHAFTAEEVETMMTNRRYGAGAKLAGKSAYRLKMLYTLRARLDREADARLASGTFLPDNGMPYFITARRIWREHKP